MEIIFDVIDMTIVIFIAFMICIGIVKLKDSDTNSAK